jgi:flagellar protein FlbD
LVTVTKLNGKSIIVNADLVEFIEETPDCLISLTTGRKLMVRESVAEVMRLLLEYRRETRGAYPIPCGGQDYEPVSFEEPREASERNE